MNKEEQLKELQNLPSQGQIVSNLFREYAPQPVQDALQTASDYAGLVTAGGMDLAAAKQIMSSPLPPQAKLVAAPVAAGISAGTGKIVQNLLSNENNLTLADVSQTVLEGALADTAGQGAGMLVELIGKSKGLITKYLEGSIDLSQAEKLELQKLNQMLKENGSSLTLAQVLDTPLTRAMENIAYSSVGGKTLVSDAYKSQGEAFTKAVDDLLGSGEDITREQFGKAYAKVYRRSKKTIGNIYDSMKNAFVDKYKDPVLNVGSARALAIKDKTDAKSPILEGDIRKIRDELEGTKGLFKDVKTLSTDDQDEIYDIIGNLNSTMKFSDFKKVLQALNDKRGENPVKDRVINIYYDTLIKDAEKSFSNKPELLKDFRRMNSFYRDSMEALTIESQARMVNSTSPIGKSTLADSIVESKDTALVRRTFDIINESANLTARANKGRGSVERSKAIAKTLREDLESKFLHSFTKSLEGVEGDQIIPKLSQLNRKLASDPKSREIFQAVIPKEKRDTLKRLVTGLENLDKKTDGSFSLAVRSAQLNNAKEGITGNPIALALSGLPWALGKITTSKALVDKVLEDVAYLAPKLEQFPALPAREKAAAANRALNLIRELGIETVESEEEDKPVINSVQNKARIAELEAMLNQ